MGLALRRRASPMKPLPPPTSSPHLVLCIALALAIGVWWCERTIIRWRVQRQQIEMKTADENNR